MKPNSQNDIKREAKSENYAKTKENLKNKKSALFDKFWEYLFMFTYIYK